MEFEIDIDLDIKFECFQEIKQFLNDLMNSLNIEQNISVMLFK